MVDRGKNQMNSGENSNNNNNKRCHTRNKNQTGLRPLNPTLDGGRKWSNTFKILRKNDFWFMVLYRPNYQLSVEVQFSDKCSET